MESTDRSQLISMVREAVRQCSLVGAGSSTQDREAASQTCSQVFTALENHSKNICGGYSTKPKCRPMPQETGYQCTVEIPYDGLRMKMFGSLARRFATIEDCVPELITAAQTLLSATPTLPLPGVEDSASSSQRRDKGKEVLGFPGQRQNFGGGSGADPSYRGSSPFDPFHSGGYPQLSRTSSFDSFGFVRQRETAAGAGGLSGRNPFQTGGHLQPSGSTRPMRPPLPGGPPRGPKPSVRVAPSVFVPPSFRGADPSHGRSTPPRWGDSLPGTPRLASEPPADLDPTILVDPSFGVSDYTHQSPSRASCFLPDLSFLGTPQQAPPQDVDSDLDMDSQYGISAYGYGDDDSDSESDSEDEEGNIPPSSEGSKTASAAVGSGGKKKRPAEILPCPVCSRTFTYTKPFEGHIKKRHAIIDSEGNYGCKKCGLSFGKAIGELVEHMQSEHNSGKRKGPAQVTSCPFCRKFFPSKESVETHIQKWHADVDSEGNYGCKVCDLPVGKSPEELNEHMLSKHKFGANAFVCPECKNPSNNQRVLKRHMKAHKNRRKEKFKCTICTKKPIFTRRRSYVMHMEEFHNPNPGNYKCDAVNCEETFSSKKKLEEHKTKKHTDKTTCPICKAVLSTPWSLKRHIESGH